MSFPWARRTSGGEANTQAGGLHPNGTFEILRGEKCLPNQHEQNRGISGMQRTGGADHIPAYPLLDHRLHRAFVDILSTEHEGLTQGHRANDTHRPQA